MPHQICTDNERECSIYDNERHLFAVTHWIAQQHRLTIEPLDLKPEGTRARPMHLSVTLCRCLWLLNQAHHALITHGSTTENHAKCSEVVGMIAAYGIDAMRVEVPEAFSTRVLAEAA